MFRVLNCLNAPVYLFIIPVIFLPQQIYANIKSGDLNVLMLDVNSILSSDLNVSDPFMRLNENTFDSMKNATKTEYIINPNLDSAINTMNFHRDMMQNYILSEYLVNQISASVSKNTQKPWLSKRIGTAKTYANETNESGKLLEDEGSNKYATWLKRLGEAHYAKLYSNPNHRTYLNLTSLANEDVDYGLDNVEEADVTGYAYTGDETPVTILKHNHHKMMFGEIPRNMNIQPVAKSGYDGYDDGYYSSNSHAFADHENSPPLQTSLSDIVVNQTKEIGLKDITNIALTTLAFLSFGMFVLQVLMCITMNKEDTTNMSMLPVDGTDDMNGADGTDEIRRKRRSVVYDNQYFIYKVQKLAESAILSIDSMYHNNSTCQLYVLCKNIKFAKLQKNEGKLWIPIWSLATGWITGRNGAKSSTPLLGQIPLISTLKAVLIGLSGDDCTDYYEVSNVC
ncbi:uncharacterized protein [Musca autumnalis]|uniref:uncharacterized protein n=1 Tax=Musca autumnalis TaxID=221902 RepID=UPI003CE6A196